MKSKRLKIVYEDKQLIVVDKPSKVLTIATQNNSHSLYHDVREYLNKKNQKCFIVHRLDYDTCGLLLFAKSEKVKAYFQNNWERVTRKYYAIVHNKLEGKGKLENYLKETSTFLTYVAPKGDYAALEYEVLKNNNKYSLVDITLLTGKKNQIRVQFNYINHPLLGDKKYGIKDDKKKMYLQSYYLKFVHPVTKKEIILQNDIDKDFISLFN